MVLNDPGILREPRLRAVRPSIGQRGSCARSRGRPVRPWQGRMARSRAYSISVTPPGSAAASASAAVRSPSALSLATRSGGSARRKLRAEASLLLDQAPVRRSDTKEAKSSVPQRRESSPDHSPVLAAGGRPWLHSRRARPTGLYWHPWRRMGSKSTTFGVEERDPARATGRRGDEVREAGCAAAVRVRQPAEAGCH